MSRAGIGVETVALGKRFGSFQALQDVSLKVKPGTFHALLGENGAGKSTLVKCLMGFQPCSSGQIIVGEREVRLASPREAQALGLGMVYQHFTLVPSLTALENLVVSHRDTPAWINWRRQREHVERFLQRMPFTVNLDTPAARLASGEKQKLEILKQLYLGSRFLVLDEPTSVLTPDEADEVLMLVKSLCREDGLTVLMITHKLREVRAFADEVSVLRRGRRVGSGPIDECSNDRLAGLMVGGSQPVIDAERDIGERRADRQVTAGRSAEPVLSLQALRALDRSGLPSIDVPALQIHAGEIVGIAGVSGNGQSELMEVLAGQRACTGQVQVKGQPFHATREQMQRLGVRFLPEEPLINACARNLSVAENLAFRDFDLTEQQEPLRWLDRAAWRRRAEAHVADFGIKLATVDSPMASLSGGNVQRAVLARELAGRVRLAIVANPCFGLDIQAVADVRQRLLNARADGTAILLISEDLDEILALSDRILVMASGRLEHEIPAAQADLMTLGKQMAGHR